MKTARALCGCGVILGASILASRADNNPTVPTTIPAATTPPSAPPSVAAPAPTTPTPVSGISTPTLQSFAVTPNTAPPSDPTDLGNPNADPERIAEQTYLMNQQRQNQQQKDQDSTDFEQMQRQQAYNNDWMMRGYAEQLKKRGLGESREINSILIADPNASNSILSRDEALLGMPDDKKKTTTAKRQHPTMLGESDSLTPKKSLVTGSYQPLLKPFEQEAAQPIQKPWDSAGTSSFDNNLTDLETSSGATLLPVPGTIPGDIQRRDSALPGSDTSMLDIPGLTAATRGAIAPDNALTFQDPGENEITNRQHPRTSASNNNFMMPTTPTNDISDFFRKQADAMRPPTAPNVMSTLVAPNHQNLPLTPAPLARPTQQRNMGMRLHIDDPFDILRR